MAASSPSLFDRLRLLVESEGAISMSTYMALANAHYYASRDPLGAQGDFTTAPEISQMFGELVGLWVADLWIRARHPDAVLVELGPGRGTLMADLKRAITRFPGLGDAPVHLVETSPALRAEQHKRLPHAHWHDSIDKLPEDRPLLIVANEFFDALPIRQIIRTASGWRERVVMLDGDTFIPAAGQPVPDGLLPPSLRDHPVGSIVETSPASAAIAASLAGRIARQGGAMLFIDYGYEGPASGDTLQAMKNHGYADPFRDPGEADLTAHVDFSALRDAMSPAGVWVSKVVEQGRLLAALGIGERARALAQANPARAQGVAEDIHRLTAPERMGRLFKALAVTTAGWPTPAGFED